MLSSYEAIYDHGLLTWLGETPGPVRARVIVTLMREPAAEETTDSQAPNGNRLSAILTRMAETDIGTIFGDPLEWQNEVRKDRPLPGRDDS